MTKCRSTNFHEIILFNYKPVIIKKKEFMKVGYLMAFVIVLSAVFMSGCNDTKIDLEKGNGFVVYDGTSYPLNFSTLITNLSSEDGENKYSHDLLISDTGNGNHVFSFFVKDNNTENKITQGVYEVALTGDYTARVAIGDTSAYLTGVMKVTVDGNRYSFSFEGHTSDENVPRKSVIFTYSGEVHQG